MNRKLKILALLLFLPAVLAGCAEKQYPRLFWPAPPETPRLEFIRGYYSQNDFPKTGWQRFLESFLGRGPSRNLARPFDVAADNRGRVFVSDPGVGNVQVYDFVAKSVYLLTKEPLLSLPLGVTCDAAGRVYVIDGRKKKIFVFSPDGTPVNAIGDDSLGHASHLAINNRLGRLYVSDPEKDQVVAFDLQGNKLFSFPGEGKEGEEKTSLHRPGGIAVDGQDRVLVVDQFNFHIRVFDADGKPLFHFGQQGDNPGLFEQPRDVAVDSEGHIHVLDWRKGSLLTYDGEGKFLLATGERSTLPTGFGAPSGIFIDAGDRIYIADQINRRLVVWQYLSQPYLAKYPIAEKDIKFLEGLVEEGEAKQ